MARHVVCSQFCHTTGSVGGIIGGLYYGNTIIIAAPTFDAQKTLDAIQQERWLICYYDTITHTAQLLNWLDKKGNVVWFLEGERD